MIMKERMEHATHRGVGAYGQQTLKMSDGGRNLLNEIRQGEDSTPWRRAHNFG